MRENFFCKVKYISEFICHQKVHFHTSEGYNLVCNCMPNYTGGIIWWVGLCLPFTSVTKENTIPQKIYPWYTFAQC